MFGEQELMRLVEGVTLFNQRKFWECHEEIEDAWMEEAGPVRYVYWTVIQVATALYHYEGKNLVGAIDMMYKAKEKVILVEKNHVESDILFKFLSWRRLKTIVLSMKENEETDTLDLLMKFRFPGPDKWRYHFE